MAVKDEHGYTLVEISVTLVAGSIVFGLVMAFYIGAHRLFSRTETRQELDTSTQIAIRAIEEDLRNTVHIETVSESGTYRMVLLSGDSVLYDYSGDRLTRNGVALGLAEIDSLAIRPLDEVSDGSLAWKVTFRTIARQDTIERNSVVAGRQTAWNKMDEL